MIITVCVIAYNEEKTLDGVLENICEQDYEHKKMEILLVDSNSTDNTKRIMESFAKKYSKEFHDIQVLDNPKRTLPCGWNVALRAYKGSAIVKVDAHARIPSDFIKKNVDCLNEGEYISGGRRPNIIDEPTHWRRTLLLAESSMFGSGIAPYRNNPGKTYVKSLFHAAYRREVFEKTGLFNEQLTRTEDNEMHYRMRQAGYKLLFNPDIVSYQHVRSSLPKMLKQKYLNGYWIGLTSAVCPKCLSLYHFVPFMFVLAIMLSLAGALIFSLLSKTAVGVFMLWLVSFLSICMWSAYGFLAVGMSVLAIVSAGENRNFTNILLPFLFLLLHLTYGIGTFVGLSKSRKWLKGIQ